MGFNKPTFILDIIDGALFIDPSPSAPLLEWGSARSQRYLCGKTQKD